MTAEATDIYAHFKFAITILAIFVPVISVTTSAVLVWAALKYGQKAMAKDISLIGKDYADLAALVNSKADEKFVEDLQKEVKDKADKAHIKSIDNKIEEINKELIMKVPMSACTDERKECYQGRLTLNCETSKQISLLVNALTALDDKRQALIKENNDMLMKIMEKMSQIEIAMNKEISNMRNFIIERESRFRGPTQEDLAA